jgi:hypothetical protein
MDEDAFHVSLRKFLKLVGVSSQREIESALDRALQEKSISGSETFKATVTLDVPGLQLRTTIDGEIKLQ